MHRVKATGRDSFFVVMTMQRHTGPKVGTEGKGLNAKVMVAKQMFSFDGEKIVLAK